MFFSSGRVATEITLSYLSDPTIFRRASRSTIRMSKSDRVNRKTIVNNGGNKMPTSAPRNVVEMPRNPDVFLSEGAKEAPNRQVQSKISQWSCEHIEKHRNPGRFIEPYFQE